MIESLFSDSNIKEEDKKESLYFLLRRHGSKKIN
jgi:hypothetical protein